jgi:hypothetical protein
MKHLKLFEDWNPLQESLISGDEIEAAKKLVSHPILKRALTAAEEGKMKWIQINITESAKAYVGVSIDTEFIFSEAYLTEDPKVALVALVMKVSKKKTAHQIRKVLDETNDGYLRWDIFPGNRAMTKEEIIDKYNFDYKVAPGNAMAFYNSPPIMKTY